MHVFCLFPKTRSPWLLHNPFLQSNWWKSKHQMQSLQQMTSVKVPQGQHELQELRGSSTKCKSLPWQPAQTVLVRTFCCKNQVTVTRSWFFRPLLMPDASKLKACSAAVKRLENCCFQHIHPSSSSCISPTALSGFTFVSHTILLCGFQSD